MKKNISFVMSLVAFLLCTVYSCTDELTFENGNQV